MTTLSTRIKTALKRWLDITANEERAKADQERVYKRLEKAVGDATVDAREELRVVSSTLGEELADLGDRVRLTYADVTERIGHVEVTYSRHSEKQNALIEALLLRVEFERFKNCTLPSHSEKWHALRKNYLDKKDAFMKAHPEDKCLAEVE